MPSLQDRPGGLLLDAEGAHLPDEPLLGLGREVSRASQAVGPRDEVEQLRLQPARQAPEGAVADVLPVLEPVARRQVVGDQLDHLGAQVEAAEGVQVEAIEQGKGRRDPRLLVVVRTDPPFHHGSRRRLPQIVAEHRQEDGEPALARQ